jgi:4-amino-4-deoxy-L-arabinose transferase-like glycosyltransferase
MIDPKDGERSATVHDATPRPRPKDHRRALAVALLLALLVAQLFFAIRTTSATDDESCYITSGLAALRTGDYRLNFDHPPLMTMALGAAAHLAGAAPLAVDEYWARSLLWEYSYFYLWTGPNAARAVALVNAARLPVVALSVLLALLVFLWARQLYGERGGLLALALYCVEPNLLAHSAVATLDLGLTVAWCAAIYACWRYGKTRKPAFVVMMGIALGAAAAIKLTGLLLLVVLPVLLFVAWRTQTPRRARALVGAMAGALVIAAVVVWGVYRFSIAPVSLAFGAPSLPLGQYWRMLAFQSGHQESQHASYLLGALSGSGWWYYYPIAFLVKTSLPLLVLLGLAFSRGRPDRDELFLVIPVGILLAAAMLQKLNLGIRYVLPLYPLLIILVGRTLTRRWPEAWRAWPRRVVVALAVWAAAETMIYAPHYLSYFNELAGGPRHGAAVLADSNVDWGQDLPALAAWQRKHPEARPLYLAYFGWADVAAYGVACERLPDMAPLVDPRPPGWEEWASRPRSGWIAASVNCLKLMESYDWLDELRPVDRAGYSILIYHIPAEGEAAAGPAAVPLPRS